MAHLLESALSTAAVFVGPVLGISGFRALRIRRLIDNTPTSRIRSMAMGLVELNGSVGTRSRVVAPFSGRPCAYWEIEVATGASRRDGRRSWSTVHRNASGHPFYLGDETGTALVYPQGAECRLPFGVQEETFGLGVPEPYRSYLEEQNLALRAVWSLGPMRFRERTLEDGASVYVLGRAFPRPMSTAVSDDDEVLQATGTETVGALHVRTHDRQVSGVVRKGAGDPVFMISPRSERTMSFEYGLKAFGGLVAAPLVSLFGVWCLIELAKSGQLFR